MSKLDFLPEELETFPRQPVAIAYEDGSLMQINDIMQLPGGEQVRVVDMLEDGDRKCVVIEVNDYFDYFFVGDEEIKLIKRGNSVVDYPVAEDVAMRARQGDSNAMFHLYSMMEYGNGIQKNTEISHQIKRQAAKSEHGPSFYHLGTWQSDLTLRHSLFTFAADAGYLPAMRGLAQNFDYAKGTEKDEVAAKFWRVHANGVYKMGVLWEEVLDARIKQLRLSPEACDRDAVFTHAMGILNAKEDKKDILLAVELLEMSASAGHGTAQLKLAELYLQGHLVRQNKETASSFFAKVAESEDGDAVSKLAQRYADGKDVEQNITYAIQLWQRAAELGDSNAQYALGNQYQQGEHLEKNLALAFNYFERAAGQKQAAALHAAGLCLESGSGVEQNMEKAIAFFQRAADLYDMQAIFKMAELYEAGYEAGNIVEKNLGKAFSCYKLAADDYDFAQKELAKYKVAFMYEHGLGVAQQYNKALEYYEAMKSIYPPADYRQGMMYKMGLGTRESLEKARPCFELAAEHGHEEARRELALLATPAEYEQESEFNGNLRSLFHWMRDYKGTSLWQDVFLDKWTELENIRVKYLELKNRACMHKPWPPIQTDELYDFYSVSRLSDLMLGALPANNTKYDSGRHITLDNYITLFEHIGFTAVWPQHFHPFQCEIVEIEQGEGDDVELLTTLWPAIMLGNMMFSRAGVKVRAPQHLLKKSFAETSVLYWSYTRNARRTIDLSQGWGSNSQWRTIFRRDFDLGDEGVINFV
ncbi:SEL1-like repeat protein [Undibacterium sp. Di26W]|uniref:SEL1-like repeat protein n=1 Tax=Undibacterium sp. Di26W TaxID=3413035 RepID=UPI003BF09AEF